MEAAELAGKVDFGIITIREDELRAVLSRFPGLPSELTDIFTELLAQLREQAPAS